MRIVIQAFMGSIIVHALYFGSAIMVGSIKTSRYKPDIENAWDAPE
jgi:menaquinol-cytochrome c reductase cytochrome b subunit